MMAPVGGLAGFREWIRQQEITVEGPEKIIKRSGLFNALRHIAYGVGIY